MAFCGRLLGLRLPSLPDRCQIATGLLTDKLIDMCHDADTELSRLLFRGGAGRRRQGCVSHRKPAQWNHCGRYAIRQATLWPSLLPSSVKGHPVMASFGVVHRGLAACAGTMVLCASSTLRGDLPLNSSVENSAIQVLPNGGDRHSRRPFGNARWQPISVAGNVPTVLTADPSSDLFLILTCDVDAETQTSVFTAGPILLSGDRL